MFRVAPYHPDHLAALTPSGPESYVGTWGKTAQWRRGLIGPVSHTVISDNRIVACYGVVVHGWPGRGFVWAAFDKDIGPLTFMRVVKRIGPLMNGLLSNGFYRLETVVTPDYPQAIRLAELLGMECEGTVRKYDGIRDFYLFSRVN